MVEEIKNTIYNCNVYNLPKINNRAGNITALENNITAPFSIKRVYYLYDIPGGEQRGGHAHKKLQQFIIAVSGAFDIILDDGTNNKVVHLDRPYIGMNIVPGIWREIINFSSGATCLVLASLPYSEHDYIRTYNDFKKWKTEKR